MFELFPLNYNVGTNLDELLTQKGCRQATARSNKPLNQLEQMMFINPYISTVSSLGI